MIELNEGEIIKIINAPSSPEWNGKEVVIIKIINNDDNSKKDKLSYLIKNIDNNNFKKIRKT